MALKIRKYPDAILRRKAQEIEKIDDETRKLAHRMVETLVAKRGGGLAAPQVGVLKRLIVVDVGEDFHILINPRILEASEERVLFIEGCLSIPGVEAEVERSKWVKVSATNLDGQPVELERSELAARALQHEIDHLDGLLFIDHLSDAKRLMLLKEYSKKRRKERAYVGKGYKPTSTAL